MVSKIEQELISVYGVKKAKADTRQDFLGKIVDAIGEEGEDADKKWNKLSEDAQKWGNEASDAAAKERPIPDFDEAETGGGKAPAKKVPAKKEPVKKDPPAKKTSSAKAPAKKTDSDGPKRSTELKGDQTKVIIKEAIWKKPSITVDEIVEILAKKQDQTPSKFTVQSIRAEFRHSLKFLKMKDAIDIDI